MENKTVTAHIPEGLLQQIDGLAAAIDRPRSWIIKQALTDWVQTEQQRHLLTLQALDEADAGQVIDHQSVVAWAESLNSEHPLPIPAP